MKITALNPHFVTESPELSEEESPHIEEPGPHLRVVQPEKSAVTDNSGGHLDRETRDGLKRLSRLIQGKKLKSRKAIACYLAVDQGLNSQTGVGDYLNVTV